MNRYTENGYKDRIEYLTYLSENCGISLDEVTFISDLLGEEDDFDALRTTLEELS